MLLCIDGENYCLEIIIENDYGRQNMKCITIPKETSITQIPKTDGNYGVCVTTNGMTRTNGDAIMGAGIAKYINERFHVANELGEHLQKHGNVPANLGLFKERTTNEYFTLFSFPTKYDWRKDIDLDLSQSLGY